MTKNQRLFINKLTKARRQLNCPYENNKNKNRFLVIPTPHSASRVMSGARTQLYLVGFTLLGGALGFYVEERVESHYKQRRFEAFEAAYEARGGHRKSRGGGEDLKVGASSSSSR